MLESDIPERFHNDWGIAASDVRYYKIISTIEGHIYLRKAQIDSAKYEQAIFDWENDLKWFKNTFVLTPM